MYSGKKSENSLEHSKNVKSMIFNIFSSGEATLYKNLSLIKLWVGVGIPYTLLFLKITYLSEVLFSYSKGPGFANFQGPCRIRNVRALYKHPLKDGHVLGGICNVSGTGRPRFAATSNLADRSSSIIILNIIVKK